MTKFKLREQFRSLSRLAFLLLGVIMASMLLLMGFMAQSSMDYLLKDNIKDTLKFKYEYVYNTLYDDTTPANTETFSAAEVTSKSDDNIAFTLCGINPDTKFINLEDKSHNKLDTNKVIISKPLADKLDIKEGDSVTAVNKLTSKEYTIKIDKIAETYVGEYVFMPIKQFNEILEYPSDSYLGIWSMEKLDIDENLLYEASSIDETIANFDASMQPLKSAIGIIALMSFIIGLIVIYVVTSLIIDENKNTISLMKVFGYRKKEINSLILNSSSIIVIIGYILSIPLLMSLMKAMFASLTQSIDIAIPIKISVPYMLLGFVLLYLTYELSKVLSRRKISAISMSEALKSGKE